MTFRGTTLITVTELASYAEGMWAIVSSLKQAKPRWDSTRFHHFVSFDQGTKLAEPGAGARTDVISLSPSGQVWAQTTK